MFIILVYFLPLETPSGTISPLTTPIAPPPKPLTSRQQVAMELLQTERNYVEILTNILKVNGTQFHMSFLCSFRALILLAQLVTYQTAKRQAQVHCPTRLRLFKRWTVLFTG